MSFEICLVSSLMESDAAGAGLVIAVGIVETVAEAVGVSDDPGPMYPDPKRRPSANNFLRSNIFAFSNIIRFTSSNTGSVLLYLDELDGSFY